MTLEEQEKYDCSSDKLKVDIAKPWFKSSEMKDMLVRVCKEKFALDVKVASYRACCEDDGNETDESGRIDEFFDLGGIDHQSNVGECPENARMFMSEKMLYDFLSNNHSFIDNSNDNGGRESDVFDEAKNKWVYDPPIPDDYEM